MPWYLYLALKQLFRTWQRIFFTGMSVLGVALGVCVMLVVLSVMAGFSHSIDELTINTQGEIQVRADELIGDPAAVQKVIGQVPGVKATTPFATGFAMLMRDNFPIFPMIWGMDVNSVEAVVPLRQFVRVGSLDDLDDDSVILSAQLAQQIGTGVGGKVEIFSPSILQHLLREDEAILPREFTVVGLFQIGHQQLDKSTAIVTLRTMQDLYELGSAVHAVDIKIERPDEVDAVTGRINQALAHAQGHAFPAIPGLWARSWKSLNEDFLWAVRMEKNIMTFILLIVVLVASFLTTSLLIMLVLKKTREIGLLGALGATRLQVALCFCFQGVGIGVVGAAAGLALGFLLLHYRNPLIGLVTRFTGGQDAVGNVYGFSQIPAHTSGSDLAIIIVAAIVMSTIAGVIPALMAARLKPAEALRNE